MTSFHALQPQEQPINVRPANEDDFLEMAEHGQEWWIQTEFAASVPYNAESVVSTLRVLAEQKMLLVATDYLDIIGFVGGMVAPMYMNLDYKMGTELFWWVHPNYRKSGVGQALLEGIEKAAKAAGCKFWTMIAMQCMAPERAGAIYEKAGYRWVERSYAKEL